MSNEVNDYHRKLAGVAIQAIYNCGIHIEVTVRASMPGPVQAIAAALASEGVVDPAYMVERCDLSAVVTERNEALGKVERLEADLEAESTKTIALQGKERKNVVAEGREQAAKMADIEATKCDDEAGKQFQIGNDSAGDQLHAMAAGLRAHAAAIRAKIKAQ